MATGVAAAGIVTTGALSNHSNKNNSSDNDVKATCELTVQPHDTVWDFAGRFNVGQKDVKFYHPNSGVAEKDPVHELQPGDIAAAKIGTAACQELDGDIGDPTHPGVIIE